MKQFNYLIMICILSMLNPFESSAQGLSLSFNLSETDTLANMIAESKKYEISSLTLSGYINEENTKYIKDLNTKGKLNSLDLSDVSHICAYYLNKKEYVFSYLWKEGSGWYNSEVGSMYQFIEQYGYDFGKLDINETRSALLTIIEEHHDNMYTVTCDLSYYLSSGYHNSIIKYFTKSHSINNPLLMFQDNTFSRLVLPDNIEQIGDTDCRFRLKKCDELVLGKNVKEILSSAFKGSHIGTLQARSTIDHIKANAFENATGNILSNPIFLEKTKIIGDNAFKNSSLLQETSRSMELQATKIGNNAFFNAVIPQTLSLPNIEEIGDSAFMFSKAVNVNMGNKIKSIGNSTFENCEALYVFEGGTQIEQIGKRAFYGCNKLNFFTPTVNLRTISQEAFANDSALLSFSIPSSVESIGYKAFANSGLKELDLGIFGDYRRDIIYGCDSLENISLSSSNTKLKSTNGVLLSKDESRIITYPCAKEDVIYEISNKVTEIEDSAFYNVNKLKALTVSEIVSKIGKNAFGNSSIVELKVMPSTTPKVTDNNSGLDQRWVRLFVHEKDYSTYYIANYWGDFKYIFVVEHKVSPDNLIHIEEAGTLPCYFGFGDTFKYKSLRLSGRLNGDDIRYLREMAGRDINGKETAGALKELDFSQASIVKGGGCYYKGLTTSDNILGESMFEGCRFTSLEISDSTTEIGVNALIGCPLESFKLPAATKELSLNSFLGMWSLKEFIVDPDNQKYMSLNGVLFTKDCRTLLLYPYSKQGEIYNVPEATTSIGEQAFGGSYLKTVITNEGLVEIETMAFDNLRSLEAISLASTLKTIGRRAFWSCDNLLNITCKGYYPPNLSHDKIFNGKSYTYKYQNFSEKTYETANLLVPEKNAGYKSSSGWKLFNHIIESDDWINGAQPINDNDNAKIEKRYDLNGRLVTSPYHGVNIIKMSNGTSKKVFMK